MSDFLNSEVWIQCNSTLCPKREKQNKKQKQKTNKQTKKKNNHPVVMP